PGVEFIGRFLQHVLPRGCVKVRYYGIWSPSCRKQLDRTRKLIPAPPSPSDSTVLVLHRSAPGHTPDSLSPLSHRSPRPCRNAACKSEPFSMMPHPLARPKLAPILALLIARSSTRVFPCRVPSPFRNLSTLILSDSFPV